MVLYRHPVPRGRSTGRRRRPPALRTMAVLVAVAALACGCAGPGPTSGPTGSPAAATPAPSNDLAVVGGVGQVPLPAAAPLPVDFEAGGDEVNGWWWLRDGGGVQQASWGFPTLPPGGQIGVEFSMLADNATDAGAASFWLSYGAIDQAGIDLDSPASALVQLETALPSSVGEPAVATGTYTIARSELPTDSTGLWVRVARSGPDGSTLPGSLAVEAASVHLAGAPSADGGAAPITPPPPSSTDFTVFGDQISGWWWLRDGAGNQRASWAFLGQPIGDQLRIDLDLLATDTVNGGRDVDARFWLTYGPMIEGGGGGPVGQPRLVTLKNISPPGDPVGYTTAGSIFVPVPELAPGAIGFWVGISRRGPDGRVLSTHIAVREASVSLSGLNGAAGATPGPTIAPPATPPPSANPYGTLSLVTECQHTSAAPMHVSSSGSLNLRLEFAFTETFSTVYTSESYLLSGPNHTFDSAYNPEIFPNGIWVRLANDHSVIAHDTNKGWCTGSTPPPSPSPTPLVTAAPTPTPGPPSGPPTIVSLGDSYISGEAGRWAGNSFDWYGWTDAGGSDAYDQPADDVPVIAGCHRSTAAEVHFDEGGYGHVVSFNLACSGATTQTRDTSDGVKPGIDNCPDDIYRSDCPAGIKGQGTLLTETARTNNVTLVVLSIGGNDFDFAKTVVQCSTDFAESSYWVGTDYCHDDGSVIARFSPTNITSVRDRLVDAYRNVVLAMRAADYPDDHWSLLIQNYPSPLPPGNGIRYVEWGYTRLENGCPFWNPDADWANDTALPTISATIDDAVGVFSANYPSIDVHVMDVSAALVGHRLCENTVVQVGLLQPVGEWTDSGASDGSEWVAQIRGIFSVGGMLPLPGSVYYKNESFHPNYWGQLALRNCLRQAWNNGNVRGGSCEFMQNGLSSFGEPQMILAQP